MCSRLRRQIRIMAITQTTVTSTSPVSPKSLQDLREDYRKGRLEAAEVGTDPILFFERWFREAQQAGVEEPNAMTLATADADGRPHSRVVLLKGLEEGGFTFYTNYTSHKGAQLEAQPWVALVFFWPQLQRQVRVEGRVHRIAPAASDAYFASRPRQSRLGAWASPQSAVVKSRDELEQHMQEVEARFAGEEAIPRPPHWGGYRVMPEQIEFWQGRSSRLHDRIVLSRPDGADGWEQVRLAP